MYIGILNERDYYRTVYGGWLGKNIGGTLGGPVEGAQERLPLTFYPDLQNLRSSMTISTFSSFRCMRWNSTGRG
jgi:hypothetical protein